MSELPKRKPHIMPNSLDKCEECESLRAQLAACEKELKAMTDAHLELCRFAEETKQQLAACQTELDKYKTSIGVTWIPATDYHQLQQQLAAVTKERDDAVKVQVHMAKEYQTRLSAAQAEVEHLQNLIPDHIRSAIAAHGDSIGETLIKLTGDYSLLRAEVARLKRLSSEDACNIIGLSEDRDDLESRTARLRSVAESLAQRYSDCALRVGDYDSESDTWPVYMHVGGLHNECNGAIAEFYNEKSAHWFVGCIKQAQQALAEEK